ncbi:thiolase-like protein [Penicillium verhagenii]|uniref:thiolase-like protein n=1 Tax=Penicillium verhagenii TaxID=1562060 RepID=UPI0025459F6C|nr:thiolase-like protein [Penicillium verhagenii]KAJ5917625.1 thiolase-like protein [Penicillium verhagenii]
MALSSLFYSWRSYLNRYLLGSKEPVHHLIRDDAKTAEVPEGTPIVSVVGTGSEYPTTRMGPEILEVVALRHYPDNPAFQKTLEINARSRIEERFSAVPPENPLWHQSTVPTIQECDELFKEFGVPLAEKAARKAIAEWGCSPNEITHIVAVTCTNTSNPGFEYFLSRRLGLGKNVQRTLLHGVGCAGGVAALRTANDLLLGAAAQGKPARCLVVACETPSVFIRRELDDLVKEQRPNVGLTLFGDCASALVLSNGLGVIGSERAPLWKILNCLTTQIPGSAGCLEYNIGPSGYLAVISKDVPKHIQSSLASGFKELISSTPSLRDSKSNFDPTVYDWALHPGGYGIILLAQQVLGLTMHHLRKSYEVYTKRGNSSSATVLSIMHKLANERGTSEPARDKMIAAAFGPGITMELVVMAKA